MNESIAILTGGNGGLGSAFTQTLLNSGTKVCVISQVNGDTYQKNHPELSQRVNYFQADLTDSEALDQVLDEILEDHPKVNLLINNAGCMEFKAAGQSRVADIQKHMVVNLIAPMQIADRLVGHWIKQKTPGQIINISSAAGLKATPKLTSYASAKAGLIHYTRCLAAEVISEDIRVNAICPGLVETGLTHRIFYEMIKKDTPLKAAQTATDIAASLAYLIAPESKHVTGLILNHDGGMSL